MRTPLPRRGWLACGVAALLGGLVYLNALTNPFVYDDHRLIVENRSILHLSDLRAIFWHDAERPLTNLSYAIDRALWGPEPFGFHLTSVLLHMANVALLFLLAWRLTEDVRERGGPGRPGVVAAATAMVFAVHPMMTEAVGYISGRAEVLCTTFFLGAALAVRRYVKGGSVGWLVLTIVLWLLKIITKESAAMFPFVVVAYDWLFAGGTADERRRRIVRLYVPLFGVMVFLVSARLAILVHVEHPGSAAFSWRLVLVELDVLRRYATLLLLPMGQTIFHAIEPIRRVTGPRAIAGLATLAVSAVVVWRLRRAQPLMSFGLVWFVVMLVPSSVLVAFNTGEPMAEHRVYLASCGAFLVIGAEIDRLAARLAGANRRPRRLFRATLAVGLLSLVLHTLVRNAVWSDPVGLWSEAAYAAPDHWLPQLALGEALHDAGRHREAVVAFEKSLSLRPEEPAGYAKLGVCDAELGRLDDARHAFEALRRLQPRSPEASNGLAAVALAVGRPDEARGRFQETLTYDPQNVPARHGLAEIAEAAGDPAEALRLCEEIRRIAPETPGNDDCIRRNRARIAGPKG